MIYEIKCKTDHRRAMNAGFTALCTYGESALERRATPRFGKAYAIKLDKDLFDVFIYRTTTSRIVAIVNGGEK